MQANNNSTEITTFGVKEAAQLVGCSEWKIRELANKGEFPCFRVGRKLRFNKQSVIQWITDKEKENQKRNRW